jgi:dGTPase
VLLTELFAAVLAGAPETLDRSLVASWHSTGDDGDRLRVVVDQIAQLTDSSAATWHERLVHQRR